MTHDIGRMIIIVGGVLVVVGLCVTFFDRIPLVGKLPGDIHIRRGNFHVYLPLATSVALSVLVTFVLWIASRLTHR